MANDDINVVIYKILRYLLNDTPFLPHHSTKTGKIPGRYSPY